MTLTDKVEDYMEYMEKVHNVNISQTSSTHILASYYRSLGVDEDTSFQHWMQKVAQGTLPLYSSLTRAIRKARENTPRWRKEAKQKRKEQDDTKAEVGL